MPRRNRPNPYVKWDVGGQGETQDNREYNDEESDNLGYYGGHSGGKALLTENGDSSPQSGLETDAIDGWNTDSDVDATLANHIESAEYRDT